MIISTQHSLRRFVHDLLEIAKSVGHDLEGVSQVEHVLLCLLLTPCNLVPSVKYSV